MLMKKKLQRLELVPMLWSAFYLNEMNENTHNSWTTTYMYHQGKNASMPQCVNTLSSNQNYPKLMSQCVNTVVSTLVNMFKSHTLQCIRIVSQNWYNDASSISCRNLGSNVWRSQNCLRLAQSINQKGAIKRDLDAVSYDLFAVNVCPSLILHPQVTRFWP